MYLNLFETNKAKSNDEIDNLHWLHNISFGKNRRAFSMKNNENDKRK